MVSVEELQMPQEAPPLHPQGGWAGGPRGLFSHSNSGEGYFRQTSQRAQDVSPAVWGTPRTGVYVMPEKSKGPELAKVA